jgi:RNA polymerase sigma-70 factor, ECF subfamily
LNAPRLSVHTNADVVGAAKTESFDELFRRLYPALLRYLHRLTGDADIAEDAAQEAFVRLLDRSIPQSDVRAWLFAVALNLVRDIARRRTRRAQLLQGTPVLPSSPAAPDEVAERGEQIARVRMALEQVPERDRQMLLMREEGFSYEEIASVVGVAPGSIGTLLGRALRRFAKAYGDPEFAEE